MTLFLFEIQHKTMQQEDLAIMREKAVDNAYEAACMSDYIPPLLQPHLGRDCSSVVMNYLLPPRPLPFLEELVDKTVLIHKVTNNVCFYTAQKTGLPGYWRIGRHYKPSSNRPYIWAVFRVKGLTRLDYVMGRGGDSSRASDNVREYLAYLQF